MTNITFHQMHFQNELLLLPNAWDAMSATILAQSGFKAIGTTSWGIANSLGYVDGEKIDFAQMLDAVGRIINAVDIPVTVDVEAGFGSDDETIIKNVIKVVELGAAGINIEDSSKTEHSLKDKAAHCQLLKQIKSTLEDRGFADLFINARIDTYLQLDKPLQESIERASAFAEAGADGLFIPGLSSVEEIKELVSVVKAPLNLMALPNLANVAQLESVGVKRLSIGNALSDACIAFIEAQAEALLSDRSTQKLFEHGKVMTKFR